MLMALLDLKALLLLSDTFGCEGTADLLTTMPSIGPAVLYGGVAGNLGLEPSSGLMGKSCCVDGGGKFI